MLQPRLQGPVKALDSLLGRASFLSAQRSITSQSHFFANTRRPQTSATGPSSILSRTAAPVLLPAFTQVRHASHNAQGRANAGTKNTAGKRLGAKKSAGEYVVPGNIIFRQRGTLWFPGENCGMGRDHTIFALEKGYVKFYKDPERHPDRKYIGITLEKEDTLPYPKNAPTKRRFGMEPWPRVVDNSPEIVKAKGDISTKGMKGVVMREGYMFREANWEIGRAPEIKGVKVRQWKRNDRWTAWRVRAQKILRNAQSKESKKKRKAKK
ncbi:60S ribosomal protein L2 [Ascosphaera apis ARSEF 7405]|uniref:Large ribosomal subunit protein bL27m n=1 Tax=Ascosphaera apis ARSEF 7405 TaxID=392613 RepID=A0A168DKD2_9EURO|nr:60S ribosomal protein L2 [Ascosphaera apis ARSEF 7405]